ncbi:MAG: acyltransferase family protein [Verrucomicrobiota bacterium]
MSSSLKYRPEIDGLRCLSVLAVIAFHSKIFLIPGGYLGVDVFFVISGFLITSIILKESADGHFSLTKFWDRRIRRILPAAAFVLLAVSLVQSSMVFRPDLQQLSDQKLPALLSFANFHFWKNTGDYWGSAAEDSPFLHYWSLSVEEQYYLLYPILLVALIAMARKHLPTIIAFMAIVSFAAFSYGAIHYPHAAFYLLPTRIWQLGAGCLLAVYANGKPFAPSASRTLIGISLIGITFLFPVNPWGIGYESLAAVAGACLVIGSGSNRISQVLLENRPAVFIGKISYSLYLWHLPIIVSLKKLRDYGNITSGISLAAIGTGAAILLSLLSFYLIEKPFRKLKYGTPIILGFALAVGCYFYAVEPHVLKRSYSSEYAVPTWHGKYYDLNPRGEMSHAFSIIANSVDTPEREASDAAYKEGGIIRQRSSVDPKIVLIGDSHGVMWSKAVDDVTGELDLTASIWAMNGESGLMQFPPIEKAGGIYLSGRERFEYDAQRQHFIQKWNPDIVIVACRWELISERETAGLFQFLESHAKRVLLIESPPVLNGVGNRCLHQYLSFLGKDKPRSANHLIWEDVTFNNSKATRDKLVKFACDRPNFSFLPTADLFASDIGAKVASDRHVYYLDDDHLTDEGAEVAKVRIKSAIQNILVGDLDRFPIISKYGQEADKTLQSTALPR